MANKMNIYLVTIDEWTYDCYSGHVVYAKNPKNAKLLCATSHRDEWYMVWINNSVAKKIWDTTMAKFEDIILSDFHAW